MLDVEIARILELYAGRKFLITERALSILALFRVKAQAFPNAYLEVDELPKRSLVVTAASVLSILFGLGMVIGNSVVLSYIIYHDSAPIVFGIELLDGNSLIGKLWGLDVVIVLGFGLTAVAALGALAGYWLRGSLKKGGRLGAALLPFYLFFGIGFEIPALYVFVPLMTVLLALGWRSLH